jgi:hypothetical protein
MQLVKVISSVKDKFGKLLPKVLRFGKDDVVTAYQANPFGVDSNPIKDMVAVYSPTSGKGDDVIVGYLNKATQANPGETRLFSLNDEGVLKTYLWLKKDGRIELGGGADNAIRYNPLSMAMNQLAIDINTQLALIATGITAGGGSYTPTDISIDISGSKIDEIKTP